MRKVKYYSNKIIDLEAEKSFLNNAKAHKVLSALVQETENYSDRYMAMVTKMSVNTYQKWKSIKENLATPPKPWPNVW